MSHDETSDTYTQLSLHTFTIPQNSFTAFRLKYAPAHEVGELNKVVFLGSIPAAWYGGKQYGLISGTVKRAKRRMKSRYTPLKTVVDKSLRSGVAEKPFWGNEEETMEESEDSKPHKRCGTHPLAHTQKENPFQMIEHGVGRFLPHIKVQEPGENEEGSGSSLRASASPEFNVSSPSPERGDSSLADNGRGSDIGSILGFGVGNNLLFDQALLESDSETDSAYSLESSDTHYTKEVPIDIEPEEESENAFLSAIERPLSHWSTTTRASKYLKPVSNKQTTRSSVPEQSVPRVTFGDDVHSNRASMSFVVPEPENEAVQSQLDREYIEAERTHHRTMQKIQGFAHRSGGRAKTKGSRVKSKLERRLISKFRAGEIIGIDRMLVRMSWSDQFTSDMHFNESSPETLRITDRWKEYFVLLRKADDSSALLLLQFYDVKKGKKFEDKPEHAIKLLPNVKVGFFSTCDKNISVTSFRDNGAKIAIMNPKYEQTAFRWLFLLKEIIEGYHGCIMNVGLPGLGQSISVPISASTLKTLQPNKATLEITYLDRGYNISQPALPYFLRERIYAKLNHAAQFSDEVKLWLRDNPDPRFCFKIYDRLDWTPFDSSIFFVMHQVMHESHTLQLREACRHPLALEDKNGTVCVRPYPVEGYLGRATNTSGSKISKFRVFYKLSYFFSVENVLFFTKLFDGRPPTPPNYPVDSLDAKNFQYPQSFIVDPFGVNEQGHIPWLDSDDFQTRDKEVVEELERRILQIMKAESMVNLQQVERVEPISHKELFAQQIYFHTLLWHSRAKVSDDEEFLECAFQLKLLNGCKLILMAPSKSVRDEWIARLNNLVIFYKIQEKDRVSTATKTRALNMKKLSLNEFVDSNIWNEYHGSETLFANPHPQLFDMSAISMSSCVLMSGYLYQKPKKHSSFNLFYAILCPGFLILFSIARRSKANGARKKIACYEHYLTIPIARAYIYSGDQTIFDLQDSGFGGQENHSGRNQLPRLYPNGWKSSEEETQLCFTLWFGKKRSLRHQADIARNPRFLRMVQKLGVTGKSIVFMAQSRIMREMWVSRLLLEINRFAGLQEVIN